ncbi:MAG: hypothetical protein ACT4PT_00210 [Methanobacteriota archaeon]
MVLMARQGRRVGGRGPGGGGGIERSTLVWILVGLLVVVGVAAALKTGVLTTTAREERKADPCRDRDVRDAHIHTKVWVYVNGSTPYPFYTQFGGRSQVGPLAAHLHPAPSDNFGAELHLEPAGSNLACVFQGWDFRMTGEAGNLSLRDPDKTVFAENATHTLTIQAYHEGIRVATPADGWAKWVVTGVGPQDVPGECVWVAYHERETDPPQPPGERCPVRWPDEPPAESPG